MSHSNDISRRTFLQLTAYGAAMAALVGNTPVFPAFAQGGQPVLPPELMPGSPNRPGGWQTTLPPLPEGVPVDPPVTITMNRLADSSMKFPAGDTIENNAFTRMVSKLFGINWKQAFTAPTGEDMNQKLNLALASGTLPDMMEYVPLSIFVQMLEAGVLEDITDTYEKYASEEWIKKPLQYADGAAWSYAEVNGRKFGLPNVEQAAQNDKLLWIRKDWLDAVKLDVPKTLEELAVVALAFKKAGLGKGATGSTIGLAATSSLYDWYGSLDPVFGGFGVIPGFWTEQDKGLMYDSIRPQMKDALALLRDWYAKGVLAQDYFSTKQVDVATKLVGGNQCGLHFTPYFAPVFGINDSLTNDPKAQWVFASVPAGPAGARKAWGNPFPQSVFAFRKGFKHVDLVLKQIGWLAELVQNPANRFHGWENISYTWEGDKVKLTDNDVTKWFYGLVGSTGNSRTDPLAYDNRFRYINEVFAKTPAEKRDAMMNALLEDPTGLQQLYRDAALSAVKVSEEQGIKNRFTSLPTPGMVANGSTLFDQENQVFTAIITGQSPLSEFDNFVSTWKSLGGEKITTEVNEWWTKRQSAK